MVSFFPGPSGYSLYCVKNEVPYRPPAGSRCLMHHTFSRTFPISLPVISWQTPTPSNTPLTQLHTYEPAVLLQSSFTGQLNWLVWHVYVCRKERLSYEWQGKSVQGGQLGQPSKVILSCFEFSLPRWLVMNSRSILSISSYNQYKTKNNRVLIHEVTLNCLVCLTYPFHSCYR